MILSICLSALAFAQPAQATDTTRVVVVATTDIHGRATAWEDDGRTPFGGGLTRVATVMDSLRKRYPGQVVLVDAGDLIQGNAFAGHFARAPQRPNPVIDAMNALAYDAATLGNHEFNFGLDFLRITLSDAAYPYVTANVITLPNQRTMFRPEVVLKRGAVRVGITGFTTPGVMVWDGDSVKGRVQVQRIGDVAPATLARLRRSSDVSIVLIHSGMGGASSYDTTGVGPENVAASLAELPDAPDLVVVGHSHRETRDTVIGKTHFVQPRNWAQSLTVTHLLLVNERSTWRVARVQADLVPLAGVVPQTRLEQRLSPMRVLAAHAYAQPVARATAPFPAQLARAEPTPLIGYIHWVQRRRTGAQLSAAAAFRTDAGLPQGDVTQGHFAALYPYENTLRALKISGGQLKAFLEHSSKYYLVRDGRPAIDPAVPGYNYDMVSGAQYLIDLSRPTGDRIVGLSVNGRVVQPTDSFTLAINSYRAVGGGGYDMLKGARLVYERGENVRDLLSLYAESLKTLEPARFAERNWRWADTTQAQRVAALFGGRSTQVVGQELSDLPRWRPTPATDTISIRVLAINDFHGALLPRTYPWSDNRPVGGAAALAAWMDSAEAQCKCVTLRFDAGDQMQGTLESNLVFGSSTVAAFNLMRLTGAAIGNHEFDWSVDTLRARLKEAKYPWLAANVLDSVTGQRVLWIKSHTLVNVGPIRVALIGYVTRTTKSIVKAENAKGLVFAGGANTFRDVLDSIKAQRPDLTVLLAHEGGFCDSLACRGEIFELAEELRPGEVDLIISGHTHSRLATASKNGIPIIQARSSGTALGIVDLKRADGKWRATATRVENVYADVVKPDVAMERLVYDMRKRTDPVARKTVARFRVPLPKTSEGGEYALGNLLADAQRIGTRADAAIMNNGGIRAGLPAGVVTYEQIFQLQPFGNQIVILDLTGAQLLAAIEHSLKDGQPDAHVSGLAVKWDGSKPPGKRVREVRLTQGNKKLEPRRHYRVAVNDFMATGGSGFTMFRGAPTEATGQTDIEVLQAYLARLPQPAEPPATGRFQRNR